MEKMEKMDRKEIKPLFHFPELPLTNTEHLAVRHLAKSDTSIRCCLTWISALEAVRKVAITGFNRNWKINAAEDTGRPASSLGGSYKFSDQVVPGYFEQELRWNDKNDDAHGAYIRCQTGFCRKEVRKIWPGAASPANMPCSPLEP